MKYVLLSMHQIIVQKQNAKKNHINAQIITILFNTTQV